MTPIRAVLAPLAVVALSLPAVAEVPLDQLSAYLNSLTTAQADFVQVNADGSKAHGQIYIQRPGRARSLTRNQTSRPNSTRWPAHP